MVMFMDAKEIQAKIKEAVITMKMYESMGGSMVTNAIKVFEQAHDLVADYPDCDLSSIAADIKSMNAQFGPYKSMAPDVGEVLDILMGIIE